jgi:hypothetical protein
VDGTRNKFSFAGDSSMKSIARIAVALILAAVLIIPSPLALACGPYFPVAIFTATTGPDDLPAYTAGNLQLLQPTYWHRPLFIAYRNLIGKPFSEAELKILSTDPNAEVQSASTTPEPTPQQAWITARDKALGKPAPGPDSLGFSDSTNELHRGDAYIFYINCLDAAYRNAVSTLDKRVTQFGAQSQVVKDFVNAQEQVFENCSGTNFNTKPKPAVIPAVAHDSDPEIVRADRAYQIAAAHFYTGDYDDALSEFDAIAKDPNSPYNNLTPYLAARTLVRKGTLGSADAEPDPHALEQAETRLRAIIADKSLAEIHPASQRLLGFVAIRVHPAKRLHELESLLTGTTDASIPSTGFNQDLTDYLWMLDRSGISTSASSAPAPDEKSQTPPIVPGDMTDWIFTFHSSGRPAYQHALQRWQETKSPAWLVAAISKASIGDAGAAELIAAAQQIPQDSTAATTLNFHRLRLISDSGKSTDAASQLDQVIAQTDPALGHSAKNQFLALRMKLSTNLDTFLRYAPREAAVAIAGPSESDSYPDPSPDQPNAPKITAYFDADSAVPLSQRTPLRLLVEAANSTLLPSALRREIVVAAWTRAILLDKQSVAREITPLLEELVPELKDPLAAYDSAQNSSSQRFAAIFAILHNPGFVPYIPVGLPREAVSFNSPMRFGQIDNFRNNWWCAPAPSKPAQGAGDHYFGRSGGVSTPLSEIYTDGKIPAPAFLTEADRAEAEKELTAIAQQPSAPNWLGKQTIDFAKSNSDDPRVPEALHLVVRATRYGCPDDSAESISKQAFDLLHSKYPDSPWTKKTPYWYR